MRAWPVLWRKRHGRLGPNVAYFGGDETQQPTAMRPETGYDEAETGDVFRDVHSGVSSAMELEGVVLEEI
jgi:hypothetical protein